MIKKTKQMYMQMLISRIGWSPIWNEENNIKFSAGILKGIFFDEKRPLYLNYGAIGFVIGHEIMHGFDEEGSEYDGNGK